MHVASNDDAIKQYIMRTNYDLVNQNHEHKIKWLCFYFYNYTPTEKRLEGYISNQWLSLGDLYLFVCWSVFSKFSTENLYGHFCNPREGKELSKILDVIKNCYFLKPVLWDWIYKKSRGQPYTSLQSWPYSNNLTVILPQQWREISGSQKTYKWQINT